MFNFDHLIFHALLTASHLPYNYGDLWKTSQLMKSRIGYQTDNQLLTASQNF